MNRDEPQRDPTPKQPNAMLGAGLAIGVAIGVALGVAMDNMAAGCLSGVAVGLGLGVALRRRQHLGDWGDRRVG